MNGDWKRGINLLRLAFRKQSLPLYWHKKSPHTYQVWQHGVMLVFFRRFCDSYTEFVEWLPNTKLPEYIGLKAIPDEGTLCKEEKRLRPFLEAASVLIVLPLLPKRFIACGDMTGLQTKRASPYYIKRIMGSFSRRGFARLELLVWKVFILGWELRLFFKDEIAMLKSLWKKLKNDQQPYFMTRKETMKSYTNGLKSKE